jgi:hypothetical protein
MSNNVRPIAGDLLHSADADEPIPVIDTLGQWTWVMHPRHGEIRFHVVDDRLSGESGAWIVDGLVLRAGDAS